MLVVKCDLCSRECKAKEYYTARVSIGLGIDVIFDNLHATHPLHVCVDCYPNSGLKSKIFSKQFY